LLAEKAVAISFPLQPKVTIVFPQIFRNYGIPSEEKPPFGPSLKETDSPNSGIIFFMSKKFIYSSSISGIHFLRK